MHQGVQLAVTLLQLAEQAIDFFVLGDVAHKRFRSRQRQNEVLGFLFETFILVSNSKLRAGIVQTLGN